MPLDENDLRHLTAAQGYIDLGLFSEASGELEKVASASLDLPEVLAVRVELYLGLEEWEQMRLTAVRLAEFDPTDARWAVFYAYATRRAVSIEAARDIVKAAIRWIPNAALLHYNFACYECQLGNVRVAKKRILASFAIDRSLRKKALVDPDLAPILAYL